MQKKRFSRVMQEELDKPSPSAEGIFSLQGLLRKVVTNIRRKKGWQPSEKIIEDFKQEQEDSINDVIVMLMNKYRQKLMSSHVTERATNAVLKQVRNWVRRRYVEMSRTEFASDEDIENFAPAVFHESAEDKLEDFERLHKLGVIDMVEFYFLFAAYHQQETSHAASLIGMPAGTAGKLLMRARERVQTYLDSLDEAGLPSPQSPVLEIKVRRNVDMDKLMSGFRHILGRSA
jgi:DNA-directed RNA polymerase specialized sigma24 family protein